MTELTFLLDLLLNHKLAKPTRDAVAARIKEVEERLTQSPQGRVNAHMAAVTSVLPPHLANQAPSTLAALAKHPELVEQMATTSTPAAVPVAQVAQTAATVAALAQRQQSIDLAISGKAEKGRTSPRKF